MATFGYSWMCGVLQLWVKLCQVCEDEKCTVIFVAEKVLKIRDFDVLLEIVFERFSAMRVLAIHTGS